jgi:hypothetical protein
VSGFTPRGAIDRAGPGCNALTVRDNKETAMRRIALLAGITATLAGGAAAFAAAPDPAAPGAAPADPYQGSWALTMDGAPAGPIARVDGCSLQGQVAVDRTGDKHVTGVAPEPCTIEFGAGMSAEFKALLNDAIAGHGTRHDLQIIRADAQGGYAFDLTHASIASVTVPKLDRASREAVLLKVTLKAERVRRLAATAPPMRLITRNPDPRTLALQVDGQPVQATSAGPWTIDIKPQDQIGETREYAPGTSEVEIGDLPIRVPEADRKSPDTALVPWADATLNKGAADERPVTVSIAGLTLTLDHAGIARADLAPRADGARSYDLYSEHAVIDLR